MKKLLPAILAALVLGAVVVAADMRNGTASSYGQPISGMAPDAGVLLIKVDNSGYVYFSPGTGIVTPVKALDGGAEFGVTAPGGGPVFVRATDAGAEFGVTGPGGQPVKIGGRDPNGINLQPRVNDAGYFVSGPRQDPTNVVRFTCPSAGTTGYKLSGAECFDCESFNEVANVCDSLNCSDAGGVPHNIALPWTRCFVQSATGAADAGPTTDQSCWSTSGTATGACTPRIQ